MKLIILRGNSGSGKSSIAREVRSRAKTPTALIEQDYMRRVVLKEKDTPGGTNIDLIFRTASFALANNYNVLLEGILVAKRYREMLSRLINDNLGQSHLYYFDVSLEETLRRHTTKSNSNDFGEKELREWYNDKDFLQIEGEKILPETLTFDENVRTILQDTGL